MKPLLRLKPYLLRYKRTLLWGVVTVIASNLFTVVQPMFLGFAIDELKVGMDTHSAVTAFVGR
jgi:ATP-binding cassette subfamily B multidrug efflux pump